MQIAVRVAKGQCSGFGTSARLGCGTLHDSEPCLGGPDNVGPQAAVTSLKSTTAIFSALKGRLGLLSRVPLDSGEYQARGAHQRENTAQSVPGAGPPATKKLR